MFSYVSALPPRGGNVACAQRKSRQFPNIEQETMAEYGNVQKGALKIKGVGDLSSAKK